MSAPTTPKDAASVAVAIPTYMDPITDTINNITGINFPDFFTVNIGYNLNKLEQSQELVGSNP